MSVATTAATTATTVAAAIAQATKASGVIVKVSPDDFMAIVRQHAEALVVHAVGGVIRENHQYSPLSRSRVLHEIEQPAVAAAGLPGGDRPADLGPGLVWRRPPQGPPRAVFHPVFLPVQLPPNELPKKS